MNIYSFRNENLGIFESSAFSSKENSDYIENLVKFEKVNYNQKN